MTARAPDADSMVPFETLDLLLLTFNCAKTPIDVPSFSIGLQHALTDNGVSSNASSLPDIVVFSLQEIAPLGHAFVGSYFLNPYLSRLDQALVWATSQADGYRYDEADPYDNNDVDDNDVQDATAQASSSSGPSGSPGSSAGSEMQKQAKSKKKPRASKEYQKKYHLVSQEHVGMTAILLFARDPSAITAIQAAHCGFGVADMGNKGAVGLRIAYQKPSSGESLVSSPSELTFVAAHLAAMEWNVRRRNANWRSIVAGLTFGNPQDVITAAATTSEAAASLGRGPLGRSHDEAASAPRTPEEEAEAEAADAAGDDAWLLLGQHQSEADVRRQLQDLSIFRPDSLLFVAGDLNYRTGDQRPPADAEYPTAKTWPAFLERDQLNAERLAGRTFHGMQEAEIGFPPTYKHDILSVEETESGLLPDNIDEIKEWEKAYSAALRSGAGDAATPLPAPPVPWRYARHRWPSWCDRVLYMDVPEWTKKRWSGSGQSKVPEVKVVAYKSLPVAITSDHQPVYLRAKVPLLGQSRGRPEEEAAAAISEAELAAASEGTALLDPRLRLPVAIDTDAWARRARARNRERLAGTSMLLFNTRSGALTMVTAVVVIVGVYWLWVGYL